MAAAEISDAATCWRSGLRVDPAEYVLVRTQYGVKYAGGTLR
jgi:hypothetical protein